MRPPFQNIAFVHLPASARNNDLNLPIHRHSAASSLLLSADDSLSGSVAVLLEGSSSSTPAAGTVYEPIMPSTETLLGMGLIVVLCAAVAWVWQNQVVPTSRTNLAISKSRGQVKKYLDELKATDPQKYLAEASSNNTLVSTDETIGEDHLSIATPPPVQQQQQQQQDRALERWLFTDWLQDNKSERKSGRQKEPALPILKDAKWNSGDNPVLAATLLIGLGVIFTAVTERVASLTS